jgi:hypothetical protein
MPLEAQKVVVQFRGLETKVDDKQAVPGDLILLENIVYDVIQEFTKRNGYQELTRTALASGKMLSTFKRELLVADGRRLASYTSGGLVDKGLYEPLNVITRSAAKGSFTDQMPDAVWHPNGVSVFAWESIENGVPVSRYSLFDNTTGQPVLSNQRLGAGSSTKPKTIALDNHVFVFYIEPNTSTLNYVRVLATNPTASVEEGTVASGILDGLYDACADGSQIYVVFATRVGNISATRVAVDLSYVATSIIIASVTPDALSVSKRGDGLGVWVAYSAGSTADTVYAQAFTTLFVSDSSNHSVEVTTGTVKNITGAGSGSDTFLFYEVAETDGREVRRARVTKSGGASLAGSYRKQVGLASKVFSISGDTDFHVLLAFESSFQSTYFMVSGGYAALTGFAKPRVVAKLAPGVGGGYTVRSGLAEVTAHGGGVFSFPYLQTDRLVSTAGGLRTQTGVQEATLTWNVSRESLELGDTLLLTGGILYAYDGTAVAEHGFHVYPERGSALAAMNGIAITQPTQTGAEAGSYQVCAVYEWMDGYGLLHQSAPSPSATIVTTGGEQFDYVVPTYTLGDKATAVSIVIYRTLVNASVFFRVTDVALPLANDPNVFTVKFSEAIPDTELSANAQLLSNPLNSMAEVAALGSDSPRFITRYRNRAIIIPSEAPGQWEYSKAAIPGVPIEFNPQQFYNPVQGGGTPLNCAIEMDDKLILFSDDRIYYTVGDGPAPNGTGNDYGNAYRVPSDVGCANPRSLVLTPQGIIFQSAKGIYLLGRDLSVQYLGASVERFNNLTVTSATLVPNSRRVVLTMAQSAPNVNMALVYDYFVQKWAVWTNYGAVDALAFGGLLTHLLENGRLYQETPGRYNDANSRVLIKLRTSWLAFAGLSGFQRVWRFILRGSYRGAHKLKISVAFNDNPAAKQNEEVDATQVLKWTTDEGGTADMLPVADTVLGDLDTGSPGGGRFANYEWQVKLLQQKCTSVQVTITEAPTDAPNEGLSISVLTFLVGMMPKLTKLNKSHTATPGTAGPAAPRGLTGV